MARALRVVVAATAMLLATLPVHAASDQGTWSNAAPMLVPRQNHTATLLRNGDLLVVGGNHTNTGPNNYSTPSAERYRPAERRWIAAPAMAQGRAQHTATLLTDGRVLVTGGVDPTYHAVASAEIYDPPTERWLPAASMSVPRYAHTATLLPDGRVLVAGGQQYFVPKASAEIYNPTTNRWSAAGSMTSPRTYHTATLLPSGKVLVVGGMNGTDPLGTADVFDPAANRWSAAPAMAVPHSQHTATLLADGQVLIVGGQTKRPVSDEAIDSVSACAERLDLSAGRWSPAGCMNGPRMDHTATLLPGGYVLILGGRSGATYVGQDPTTKMERYNVAANQWEALSGPSVGHSYHTASLLASGDVLIAGGFVGVCPPCSLDAAELYRPPGAQVAVSPGTSATGAPTAVATGDATDATALPAPTNAPLIQGKPMGGTTGRLSPYLLVIPASVFLLSVGWMAWRRLREHRV